MQKLSIIIPVYNEENTMFELLSIVDNVSLPGIEKELVVVNDQSTDNSKSEIERFISSDPKSAVKFIEHTVNKGKGGAIQTGIQTATGEYTLIQDADLELDPNEYGQILQPVLDGESDIVYGSRFLEEQQADLKGLNKMANLFLTWLSNIVFRTKITDMETCYKLVPTDVFQSLNLVENRFGFDPEITAKLSKNRSLRWKEVPITYTPRTNEQGKKIGWTDGVRAIYCILKYGWFTSKKSSFKK